MINSRKGGVKRWEEIKITDDNSDANEEPTSRNREEQLVSSVKSNSCLSYKGGNHTAEMEQGEGNACWDSLPSVILQEIFSYLPHYSRMLASQVCRNWRYALLHPSFWKKITFTLNDEHSICWARFLIDCFGLSVHEVTIRCDMQSHFLNVTPDILRKLSCNRQLRKLFLESSTSVFLYPIRQIDNEDENQAYLMLMQYFVKIVETSNHLEALSLGCIEELTASASIILEPLRLHHAKHLTHLSLASVKDEPDHYDFLELDSTIFKSFIRLSILTIDYDFVSDALLKALDSGTMERLVIHVHGWNDDYPGTTDAAWKNFVQKNRKCELRLNLIHSYVGIKVLDTDILHPSMPLTHLKVLFCESVNIRALHRLSRWYPLTLKSLRWIDSIDPTNNMPATFDPNDPDSPDPLVLVAWKCKKLVEIVFIGHKYYQDNLLAIARLRGYNLQLLGFTDRDIAMDEDYHRRINSEAIRYEIQEIMCRPWKPLRMRDLPPVIMDPFRGDSREVIMPLVLCDQK